MASQLNNAQRSAVRAIMQQYMFPFNVELDAIDLRAMSKNFPNGIIPNEKIAELTNALLDNARNPKKSKKRKSIDPREANLTPKFGWFPIDDTAINPVFQRDFAANHCAKIEDDFDPKKIIVPCAIKDVVTGKFLIWDGHHTTRVLDRQGWTHIPLWYIEMENVDLSTDEKIKAMILLAGQAFLSINKKNKRQVHPYDEHYIRVECYEPEALIVENIIRSCDCQVARHDGKPGNISHVAGLYKMYDMESPDGTKGFYLRKALEFIRKTWPEEAVNGVIMQAMTKLYKNIRVQTINTPDEQFDTDLGDLLKNLYGPSTMIYDEIFDDYKQATNNGRDNVNDIITNGIMQLYEKHIHKMNIGTPSFVFKMSK